MPIPILHISNAFRSVLEIIFIMAQRRVTAWNAAKEAGLPVRYAEQYLQPLVHAGILCSKRGPQGGTWLDCDLDKITLGDIFRIMNDQTSRRQQSKEWTPLRDIIDDLFDGSIEKAMMAALDTISLRMFIASVDYQRKNNVHTSACPTHEARL